jgi:biogenesis of lysosome-related organelles complex 1 subunit 2
MNADELNSRSSSFEALNQDQHDPNLSRLAKTMFQKTSDYLNYEVSNVVHKKVTHSLNY